MLGGFGAKFERFAPISISTRVNPTATGEVIILEIRATSSQLKISGLSYHHPRLRSTF